MLITKYYVWMLGSDFQLDSETHDEAIAEIQTRYANCGKINLFSRRYKLMSEDITVVDTDV